MDVGTAIGFLAIVLGACFTMWAVMESQAQRGRTAIERQSRIERLVLEMAKQELHEALRVLARNRGDNSAQTNETVNVAAAGREITRLEQSLDARLTPDQRSELPNRWAN